MLQSLQRIQKIAATRALTEEERTELNRVDLEISNHWEDDDDDDDF